MLAKSLFVAALSLSAFVAGTEAQAGCNRGTFYCSAEGQRNDGRWVTGQASTQACAGTQGVNIRGIMENMCYQALQNCVSQFGNPNIGRNRCRVIQAYYANNNGHFPQGDFLGRRLRGF